MNDFLLVEETTLPRPSGIIHPIDIVVSGVIVPNDDRRDDDRRGRRPAPEFDRTVEEYKDDCFMPSNQAKTHWI
jgi:hypothetical protein